MDDKELLKLNELGIIPGSFETKEDFLLRADYCLRLKTNSQNIIKDFDSDSLMDEFLVDPSKKTKLLFDISPKWVPVFFSNHRLMPWHGGAAWIFQENEKSPISAFFQLRHRLKRDRRYLGIYDRHELMAHEMSHIGRMVFHEPRFEELIAYQTSESAFRRFFGCIVRSSSESFIFMFLILSLFLLDLFFIASGQEEMLEFSLYLKLIPLSIIGLAFVRLWNTHQTFFKAKENLKKIAKDESLICAILYRLQDKEIEQFSRWSREEMLSYIETQECLRWRVIKTAYL